MRFVSKKTKESNLKSCGVSFLIEFNYENVSALVEQVIYRQPFTMTWSQAQRQRLAFEKSLLEKYFGSKISWIDPTGNTRVEVRVICSNDKRYTLRVYLPSDYPNSCPEMIVSSPSSCLRTRDGSPLNSGSTSFHILSSKDGCTQICHFNSGLWRSENTLYQIVMKGMIWLEAYEAHLRTGQTMDRYLQEMRG